MSSSNSIEYLNWLLTRDGNGHGYDRSWPVMTVTDVGRSKVSDRPVDRPTVDRGLTDGLTALWPTVDRGLTDSLTGFEPKFTEKTFFGENFTKNAFPFKKFHQKAFFR